MQKVSAAFKTEPLVHFAPTPSTGVESLACVAWRFLSNLSALGKRGSRDIERKSHEEPGRETQCEELY